MSWQMGENTLIYVVVTIVFLSLIAMVIWLALRPIRLWYWKKSAEFKILQSIDDKLSEQVDATENIRLQVQAMENKFDNHPKDKEFMEEEVDGIEEALKEENQTEEKENSEVCEKLEADEIVETEEMEMQEDGDVVFSRKGTAFSEKELYEIIKF